MDTPIPSSREFRSLNETEKQAILIAAKRGKIPPTNLLVERIDRLQISYENQ